MPVSEQNIGFNDITQELYGRVPQVGDNLLQMFEDAPEAGFDPLHDVGAAGPGDAMSEFKAFNSEGIFGGSWESYSGTWYNYTPDSVYQRYFSAGSLNVQARIWSKPVKELPSEEVTFEPLNTPITATLKIAGLTLSTIDTSIGTSDFITFKIYADAEIPDGVYSMDTDITITLRDAAGYIVNARKSSTFTHLHIYDKGTSAYRWQWSNSATDSYPIVYPTAIYSITPPLLGSVPGSSSPAINVKVTDMAGFSDIKAFVSLGIKGTVIGNETDGWVALGSSFTLDTNKKLIFDVQIIRDFIDGGTDIVDILFVPIIKLTFGNDAFSTLAALDPAVTLISFYKTLTVNDTLFTWEWNSPITKDTTIDTVLDVIPEDDTVPITTTTTTTIDTSTGGTTLTKDDPTEKTLIEIIQ